MPEVSTNVADASDELLGFRADYETLKEEIDAVPETALLPINVPIPLATQAVLGSHR